MLHEYCGATSIGLPGPSGALSEDRLAGRLPVLAFGDPAHAGLLPKKSLFAHGAVLLDDQTLLLALHARGQLPLPELHP